MNLLKDLDIEVEIFDQKKEKLALNLIIKEEELEQWKY
jgi:hypothetical protein